MTAIQAKNLTKCYGDASAVDGVSFSVNEGELFALLGVNGAGKTTTIKMLSCLIRPSGGDAVLLGNSILGNPLKIKQITNISPQETAVAPNLSVLENLEFIAGIYGENRKSAKQNADIMAKRFDMVPVLNKKAKTLSGGMQRRLSIAMALISEPKILFLDEPTLGLDVLARRELWSAIQSLKGRVTMILQSLHEGYSAALRPRYEILKTCG